MSCAEARLLLSRQLDEAIEPTAARALASHLATCQACRALAQAFQAEQSALVELSPALAATHGFAEQVVAALDQVARREALAWALDRLPSEDRLLLQLRVGEGLSYERLAELLGTRPATVGTRLYRARIRLHQLVNERLKEASHELR